MIKCELIFVGKNDDYHRNYIERTSYALSYNLQQLEKAGLSNCISLTIVDWGSEIPLAEVIGTYSKHSVANTIYISRDEIIKYGSDPNIISLPIGINAAIRRSEADYFIWGASDLLADQTNWTNIYYCVSTEVNKSRIVQIQRKFIPESVFHSDVNPVYFDIFPSLNNFKVGGLDYAGSNAGWIGTSSIFINELSGLNENISGWGADDTEIFVHSQRYSLPINASEKYGIFVYKLPYDTLGRRSSISKSTFNWSQITERYNTNWGMISTHLNRKNLRNFNIDSMPKFNTKKMDRIVSRFRMLLINISYCEPGGGWSNILHLRKLGILSRNSNLVLTGDYTLVEYLSILYCMHPSNLIVITTKENAFVVINFLHMIKYFSRFIDPDYFYDGNVVTIVLGNKAAYNPEAIDLFSSRPITHIDKFVKEHAVCFSKRALSANDLQSLIASSSMEDIYTHNKNSTYPFDVRDISNNTYQFFIMGILIRLRNIFKKLLPYLKAIYKSLY